MLHELGFGFMRKMVCLLLYQWF